MPTVQRQGITIHYEATGRGPCVVMAHSFMCDRTMFRHQAAALSARYRVLNVDLRGHGDSGDAPGPYSIYDLTEDVIAVLDAESVERAAWVGLSIGGFLSMRAALLHPERVAALVLMDTDAGAESAFKRLKYGALRQGLSWLGAKPLVGSLLPIFVGTTSLKERQHVRNEVRSKLRAMRLPSALHGIGAITSRDDVRARLGAICCPTLVLVGEEDQPLPPPLAQAMAERIPGARLAVIPRSGHLSALETPEAVTARLSDFLNEHYAAAALASAA